MASEDLFEGDFSEEIICDYAESIEITAEERNEPENEQEDEENNDPAIETTIEEDSAKVLGIEEPVIAASNKQALNGEPAKLVHLPLTRVRNIMKLDPDLAIASNEAVFLVTRATELFIESLAVESYSYTAQAKKKTVQKRDVDLAISAVDSLMFLDGAMTF